jgi:lipopolysaccharide biosynthesis glycosyltransferase
MTCLEWIMTREPPITVLYCIDNAYLPQAGVALSALLDAAPDARFEVVVAAFGLDVGLSEAVFGAVLQRRDNASLRFVAVDEGLFEGLPVTRDFSRSIYTRLVLQRFIAPETERVLYLDADTIVQDDIGPLWRADLGAATLGVVRDHFRLDLERIDFAPGKPYFNSGVLLIDMARWRQRDCEGRVLELLARRGRDLPWMDQDALNIALGDEARFLDLDWNWQPRCADVPAEFLGLDAQRYEAMRAAPRLVHYTTSFKPWNAAHRVHYSASFFAAAAASGIPADLLPARPAPRGLAQQAMRVKTLARWHVPAAFRAARRLVRPEAAAEMYRSGPGQ